MLRNYLKLTMKVLRRKRVYTAVTLAGIVIPVTFIVLVTSFLVQINNYRSPRSNFRNVFFLDNLVWEEVKDDGSVNQHNENPPNLWFVQRYVKTMETPKLVSVISNEFNARERIYHGNQVSEVGMLYTDDVFWQITDFRFLSGRPYNLSEYEQGARVVVIDRKTSMDVFGTTDASGKEFRIKNRLFKVTGVVENTDITMYRIASNLYLPYSCRESFYSDYIYSNFSRALLLADSRNDFEKLNREFKQKLDYVTFDNTGDINRIDGTLVRDSYLKRVEALAATYFHYHKDIKKPLYVAGFLLVFLFIILPAINLVNININRVYERLSEIGVRKTFGATIRKLTGQFLFENVVITITGGILSILLSAVIISILNRADALGGVYMKMNYAGFAVSLAAILVIGVLSGILPSVTMARARIVECLNSSE